MRALYSPEPVPSDPEKIPEYLGRELYRIQTSIEQIHDHEVLTAEPGKLKDGLIRVADGTEWDPGSGEGPYCYIDEWLALGKWTKVKRTGAAVSANSDNGVIIGVTDTTSPRTITILTAGIVDGRIYIIKDESGAAGTNNITVATEGAETIDGAATATISTNYGVLRVYSDGSNLFTW